ncbi:DUF3467 domain-containing protein [Methanocaldococcus sp. 10A]
MKKPKKEPIPKAEDFIERFASGVIVGYSNEGVFIIDFLKPDIILYDEGGKIVGNEARLLPQTRIFLPPKVAKVLMKALQNSIKDYEKKFGEIPMVSSNDESKKNEKKE